MIKPSELRLGNLVDVINEEGLVHGYTVVAISNDSISVMKDRIGMVVEPEHLSPITITEDWLKHLGFFQTEEGINSFGSGHWSNGKTVLFLYGKYCEFKGRKIKYLHEFQNGYHWHVGTELTIKETV